MKTRSCRSLAVLLGLLFLTAMAGRNKGALAYLADAGKVVNEIPIGGNVITIEEEFDPPEEIDPGTSFHKEVRIVNTGEVPCYVRVLAEFSDSRIEDIASLDLNTEAWTEKKEDGYYYYRSVLPMGEKTAALFTTVTISSAALQEDCRPFDIIVYAESVQSEGFASADEAWAKFDGR